MARRRRTPADRALPAGGVDLPLRKTRPASSSFTRCPEGVTLRRWPADPMAHGTAKTQAFHHHRPTRLVSALFDLPHGGAAVASTRSPRSSCRSRRGRRATSPSAPRTSHASAAPGTASRARSRSSRPRNDTEGRCGRRRHRPAARTSSRRRRGRRRRGRSRAARSSRSRSRTSASGSPIAATKPVALFGGAGVHGPPERDSTGAIMPQQQIAPFAQWGSEYALVPLRGAPPTRSRGRRARDRRRRASSARSTARLLTVRSRAAARCAGDALGGPGSDFFTDALVSREEPGRGPSVLRVRRT